MAIENDTGRCAAPRARAEAAQWSARLHSGSFSARERAELASWRQSNSENEIEFQAAERLGEIAAALPRGDVEALYGAGLPEQPGLRRRRMLRNGLALACAAGIAASVGIMARPSAQPVYAADLATRKGERRSVGLPDGSVLELNTDSAVKVALYADERRVQLLRGEVMFAVDADAGRPFIVDAEAGQVRVTGTRFNVRRDPDRVSVAVESGSVEVSGGRWWRRDTQRLTAGQGLSFDLNGVLAPAAEVDIATVTAWRSGRLVFRNASLSEVIDEINRYLDQPIRLADAHIRRLRVTASFLVDDPGALLGSLQRMAPVDVRHLQGGGVALVARPQQ